MFEKWLFEFYEPYLAKNYQTEQIGRDFVLLFNAKLPLIDRETMRRIHGHNNEASNRVGLQFFGISREEMLPFESLFKKTVRNRRVNVLLDSWRKTVQKTMSGGSSKLKFESAAKFIHVFEEAFQNCIEESVLVDNDERDTLNSSVCVQRLRLKISDAFELTKLWPIKLEIYEEYLKHAKKMLMNNDNIALSNIENGSKSVSAASASASAAANNKMDIDEEGSDSEQGKTKFSLFWI